MTTLDIISVGRRGKEDIISYYEYKMEQFQEYVALYALLINMEDNTPDDKAYYKKEMTTLQEKMDKMFSLKEKVKSATDYEIGSVILTNNYPGPSDVPFFAIGTR
jgi:cell shape-determining protein MreC